MNNYTVYNLKQDMDSDLHSGGVSGLQNFYNTLDKGRRAMIKRIRPEELIRTAYLEQALYPNVDRYSVPEDLKYSDVIELNMLSAYRNVDTMSHPLELVYRRRFGQKRNNAANVMNIGYDNGVKYTRIFRANNNPGAYSAQSNVCRFQNIHDCNSLTANGTWNVGGNVVNLRVDELNHVIGRASLAFNIDNSSTSGFIENFSLTEFDLNDFLQRGATFLWLDLSVPKELLSVKLTLGSDPTNLTTDLYTSTVNQPHDNNAFTTGWNLLKYMLNNLLSIGTPNPKALKYIRVEFTTTGVAIPNCHMDNIVARMGDVYQMTYNSSYVFQDPVTKAFKKFATSGGDLVCGEEDTYDLLRLECTLAAMKELYGSNYAAKTDVADIQTELAAAYKIFAREHKSEALVQEEDSHVFGNEYDGYTGDIMPGAGNDGGWSGGPEILS